MDAGIQPVAKRKRIDNDEDHGALKRGDPWFEDGNIILQAEQTQFRVYRGLLASSSDIFTDMFMIPQPTATNQVGGCAIIELPDSALDWEHVLKAMFQRGYSFSKTKSLPLTVVTAFLRLGKKYNFQTLLVDALERFGYHFSDCLMHQGFHISIRQSYIDVVTPADYIDVINLARETGIISILPTTFLQFINGNIFFDHIIKGALRADGSLARLSENDQLLCLNAWNEILSLRVDVIFGPWLDSTVTNCADQKQCLTNRLTLASEIYRNLSYGKDAFKYWDDGWTKSMCDDACLKESARLYRQGREKAWQQLPSLFGLPGWKELKNYEVLQLQ